MMKFEAARIQVTVAVVIDPTKLQGRRQREHTRARPYGSGKSRVYIPLGEFVFRILVFRFKTSAAIKPSSRLITTKTIECMHSACLYHLILNWHTVA